MLPKTENLTIGFARWFPFENLMDTCDSFRMPTWVPRP